MRGKIEKDGLCSGPCPSCDQERKRRSDIELVLRLMIENIEHIKVPIPTEIFTSRVPALKLEAKKMIQKALDKHLKGK
jgi:hypothetical protein